MRARRTPARKVILIAGLMQAACVPGTITIDETPCPSGECAPTDGGTLVADGVSLAWSAGATWDQGWCIDLTLTNTGEDLEAWAVTVQLDQPVAKWLSAEGAVISPQQNLLSIQPAGDTALASGAVVTMQCCMEPAARPVGIASTDLEPVQGTPMPLLGTVQDGTLLLAYRTDGASYGGVCLEMTLSNLSDKDIAAWSFDLSFDQKTTLTDYWGFTPVVNGATATVYPGTGTETITAYGARTGTMCLNPLAEPVAMVASVRYEDGTGTDVSGTPTPAPVVTGSLSDDPLLLTYRSTDPSKGGVCLELTFTNTSDQSITTWDVQLTMTGPVTLTDFWGFAPSVSGSLLTIYPGPGQHTMEPFDARIGTVCLDPLETPVAMITHAAFATE